MDPTELRSNKTANVIFVVASCLIIAGFAVFYLLR
jgi:hypothetical protein